LSVPVITLASVTMADPRTTEAAPAGPAPPDGVPVLDAAVTSRCRRRVHLDHDPAAHGTPRARPDPALQQRRSDAAEHRRRIGERLARAVPVGWTAVPETGSTAERIAATAAAVAREAPLIWGAVLPEVAGRRGGAELLVRRPAGGYVPVIVVRHRITDPGEGALTSSLDEPWPDRAAPDPGRRVRSQPRDLLRLAHLNRMLRAAGWDVPAADPGAEVGGVIGLDADVVCWYQLGAGHWSGERSTLAEYDLRFTDRRAVATAAAHGAPALAAPSRVNECRHCPWWPTCEVDLQRGQDVSLVVRGETAAGLRAVGVSTVAALAALDPLGPAPTPELAPGFADAVVLARAWLRGLSVVRRAPRVPVVRADVEVDVDMESFGESGAYLWGALLRHPGGRRADDEPDGYRAFATWEPVPTVDEARSFAEFWAWFTAVRDRAAATGRSFAAYCYNAHAENRWLLGSAQRFAGHPGVPALDEVQRFVDDPTWIDLYAVVGEWFLCAHGKGLKRIAPVAGFAWRDPEAGGENSMRWYRDAVGLDGATPDPEQRARLLRYNADDVAATATLRDWMTSDAIEVVPLASDL
jgi:predicted RecB family nuclease